MRNLSRLAEITNPFWKRQCRSRPQLNMVDVKASHSMDMMEDTRHKALVPSKLQVDFIRQALEVALQVKSLLP